MSLLGDRYELGEVIGSGGMSDVYAAEDTLLGREVAVKMLKLDMARDDNFRERFRREAQNSAKLNHPHIVATYDTGETELEGVGIPYIVMERVHGQTLRDMVREGGPLEPQEAAELLGPVCDALQASHDAGIIHRDIKPANIMINNTGSVKIMDFGIARALDDATSSMTQTSAVIGTAQYLSPEQARGKSADARSDVYALGCVLYETVTGTPPFEGESPFAVAYQHVQEEPTPPSEHISDPNMTPTGAVNIDAVTLTAMAKHPADRYQTVSEMGVDLGLLARGAVTHAARSHVAVGDDNGGSHRDDDAPPTTQIAATGATAAATAPASAASSSARNTGTAPWVKWLAVALALLLIGAIAAFALNFLTSNGGGNGSNDPSSSSSSEASPDMVPVPDIIGWHEDDATAELEGLGLVVEKQEEPSPDIEANFVSGVSPGVGSELRAGTTVTLTISTGRETIEVPDIVGMTPQDAANALQGAGLLLRSTVQEENSDTVPEGLVTAQSPAAGAEIAKGTEVTITVSLGRETVTVPSLTGMNVSQAEQTLRSLDLEPRVVEEDSLEPDGEVLRVETPAESVPRGTTVTLFVSNGMLFTMPDITRLTPESAVTTLRQAGWQGDESQLNIGEPTPTAALVDSGLISFSSPSEGETVRVDDQINIRVFEFDVAVGLENTLPGISRP